LDAAWIGVVLALMTLVFLLSGNASGRWLLFVLWVVTGVHLFVCVANAATFAERNQCAGELLLPYLTSPYQVYLAVAPFMQRRWLFMLALCLATAAYAWAGMFLSGFVPYEPVGLRRPVTSVAVALTFALVCIVPCLHLVPRRKVGRSGKARGGWRLTTTKAKYYMDFTDYAFNQAVANPLLDFVFQQLPAHFKRTVRYRLSETEALGTWLAISGRAPMDAHYPLLERIRGQPDSPIENLLVLQIEGFSQSLLEQQRAGRPVMPFLNKLAREGYYFPNTFQCANYTSGGVFSTMTSMPQATYDEPGRRFANYELNGYYGSPAHIFGADGFTHFFLFGFRQSADDFTAFAANQGYRVTGYFDFVEILRRKGQLAEADTLLGILDGYFLDECAEILLQCPHRFTAHLTTATTHSPWTVPQSFVTRFEEPMLNAFAYLDDSIQRFCERLQGKPGLWEKTLLVILGDHTSVTFGQSWLERFRIPLIFYHPDLPARLNPDARRASQLDVLPTALALFAGERRFAGMGRNLLDRTAPEIGFVSGTSALGYYLKENSVLSYEPLEEEARLFELKDELLAPVADQHSEAAERVRKEYFATVELAKRLAVGKQVFPFAADPVAVAAAGRQRVVGQRS
jgi:phosphoglycerol transferase MdoB-like AlkP superfamily enzyme